MKNRTMLITAGFGLLLILSLFIGSVGVQAGSVEQLSSPPAAPITAVAITAPANDSFLSNADVTVTWTVTGADNTTYNHTRIWNATDGWSNYYNDTTNSTHVYPDLIDGMYFVEVMAINPGVNSQSANVSFTIDTVKPVVEVDLPFEERTNLFNFTFDWIYTDVNGLANTTIVLTGPIAGSLDTLDDSTSESIGNVTGASLTEGDYELNVTVWDVAGNSGFEVVEFSVGPILTINEPSGYTNDNNLTFVWTVLPYEGDAIDDQQINVTNIDTSESWTMALNGTTFTASTYDLLGGNVLVDGNYTVKVIANDTASSDMDIAIFVVDTVAPTLVVDSPAALTNDNNVTFEWTMGGTGSPISNVDLSLMNVTGNFSYGPIALGNVDNANAYDLFGILLNNGNWTLTLNVTDMAGNYLVVEHDFVVDTVAPTLVVDSPAAMTNDNNVTFEWTMNDIGSSISNVDLSLMNVTGNFTYGPIALGDVDNASAYDLFGILLNNGNWTLTLNVTDMAGNYLVVEYDFVIDTVAPIVGIVVPTAGSFVNSIDVVVVWSATDPSSPVASGIDYFNIRADSGNWTTLNSTLDTYTVIGLSEGVAHLIELRAYDMAGNFGETNVTFTIDIVLPEVQIIAPTNDTKTNMNSMNVSWTGNDSNFDHFEVKIDNGTFENVGANLSKIFDGLSDGEHTVLVMAVDMAGNSNTTQVMFTVDATSPSVTITLPAAGMHTNVTDVQMNWTAVDNTTGVAYMHVWNDTGAPINMTSGDGYLFINLTEGTHTLHVKVWDMLGNAQEKMVSVVIDMTGPEINITHPQWGQHVNGISINATWTAMDDLSPIVMFEVKIDNGSYENVGLNEYKVFADVIAGDHTIYVRATDSVGNSAIQHVFFSVDVGAPTVLTHLPASGAVVSPDVLVKVTFSEAMNQSSVTFTGITGTKTWNTAGTEVTLAHAALTYATTYNVVVSGRDIAGNLLTGSSASWSFSVVTQVTGTVNDDKGNPIVNATVKLTQGSTTVVEGVTDANGHFALLVNDGAYNLTISKSGFQDFVQNDKAFGVGQNNTLGALTMTTSNADYTLLIVGVIVVLGVVLAAFLLLRRRRIVIKP